MNKARTTDLTVCVNYLVVIEVKERKARILAANTNTANLRKLFSSESVSRRLKLRVYKSVIRPNGNLY